MTSADRTYTMEDLTRATGFKARQIRYYITRKLVPGAGERGPNVTYGQETLDRLLLVKRLKEMTVQPTGRSLTLDEIGSTIASLGDEGTRQLVADGIEMSIIDTEDSEDWDSCLSLEQPRISREIFPRQDMERVRFHGVEEPILQYDSPPEDLGELGPLLRSLHETLADLLDRTDETQNPPPRAGAEAWRRVRTPDIEIQVRVPDDESRRERLERIRGILIRLLDQGRYGT